MEELQTLVDQLAACDEEGIVTVVTSVMQARPETAPAIVQFAVPDLTYPPQRALAERRSTGTVKSYNESKGFGFIACEELSSVFGNDVFLHASQAPPGITPGQYVSFAVCLNQDNKPQAYDLQVGGKGGKGPGKGPSKGEAAWGGAWGGKDGGKAGGKVGGMDGGKDWQSMMAAAWSMMTGKGFGKDAGGKGAKGGGKPASKSSRTEDGESIGEYTGTIKSYNPERGYGFIDCEDVKAQYGNDVFLNHTHVGEHTVGELVTFDVFENSLGKPQAKNLRSAGGGDGSWGAPAAKRQKTGGTWGDFA
mmetsp:Transcript_56145/g.162646  ORF Transcript_56145/g.162646 Transcript_56145/m.162646 type:complete len:305 (+) Transcript_56145:77-991(+)